jgi:hypothetical protein
METGYRKAKIKGTSDVEQYFAPPPVISNAWVLAYAVVDDSVKFAGRTLLFVDGKEVESVPCLAIAQSLDDGCVLLLHCSADWGVLATATFPSMDEARKRAEKIYRGLSWKKTNFTRKEAERYLDEVSRDQRCSFCGKRPDQIDELIEKKGARICDCCIREFHQMLSRQ